MYSSKLILSAFAALLIPALGVSAQAGVPAGCSSHSDTSQFGQNGCASGTKFCGGVPNLGLAWICCPNSHSC
ncbi:hypothetical protein LX32DRAFT_733451 [Colletotrichum zoysiae]|uniref:Uncharacterized protein n=1 Tax=Colletotrichum zoysiae TaxID=1216348 RepID=A0AAD9LTM3_9PEZI|nr:hypothetical protein LX32DRAFT_733451 [Colletotrichum zoysiae]